MNKFEENVKIIHKQTKNELFFDKILSCFCFVENGKIFKKHEASDILNHFDEERIDTSKMEVICAA